MDLDTLYRRTLDHWTDQVRKVAADQWDLPTPCSDWTVRALVNHVAGEDLWTVPLLQGSTIAEVGDRFDGDLLGDEPIATALDATTAAAAVAAQRLPEGGTVQLSYGEEQLEEYVRQLAADHLVHGWDLAAAIGASRVLDPDAVDAVASWFTDREDGYRRAGVVGPRPGSYDDPQDDLLAGFGRDRAWGQS